MAKPMKKMDCPCDDCPKAGDVYVCDSCKMTVVVAKNCACSDPACVSLACCGTAMCKAN